MLEIAVRRLKLFPVEPASPMPLGARIVVLAELARLGILLDRPEVLATTGLAGWTTIHRTLLELRGAHVDHVPLFSGFPESVPDDVPYLVERILGSWGLFQFDRRAFGADPVSQFQDPELYRAALAVQATRADGHVEPLALEVVAVEALNDRLVAWLSDVLRSRSAIPKAHHADVRQLIGVFGCPVPVAAIGQRETLALVAAGLWTAGHHEGLLGVITTPTDLLRMFAVLTGTDVTLVKGVRFPRMGRAQRRVVLDLLAGCSALEEDLLRYEGLWKAVARSLHVGEFGASHAEVVAAFAALRNGTLRSFESRTEALIQHENPEVLNHLSQRPGLFARRLHQLLRMFSVTDVVAAFASVAAAVPTKTLLSVHAHFLAISTVERRTIITRRGRIKVLPNPSYRLDEGHLEVVGLCRQALLDRFAQRPPLGRVWIDPQLSAYTVPLQLRDASDGFTQAGRGSWLPLADAPVIRVFIWWKDQTRSTDLDLALATFDDRWRPLGHVSWTRLKDAGVVHSGDIQSAPLGAAEFIDVTLDGLPENVRYVAPQVHSYQGDRFGVVEAHAGWMMRQAADGSRAPFDPATVQAKFVVSGRGSYVLPFVVDVEARQALVVDLYVGSRALRHSTVEGNLTSVGTASEEVARFTRTRPDLHTLAMLHAEARGTVVSERQEAESTFGLDGCDFNGLQPEHVLADWL